jgi:hypothetical protein
MGGQRTPLVYDLVDTLGIERLGDNAHRAIAGGANEQFPILKYGQEAHFEIRVGTAEETQRLQSVEAGHQDIQKNQVECVLTNGFEGLKTVPHLDGVQPQVGQDVPHPESRGHVIIRDQNHAHNPLLLLNAWPVYRFAAIIVHLSIDKRYILYINITELLFFQENLKSQRGVA